MVVRLKSEGLARGCATLSEKVACGSNLPT